MRPFLFLEALERRDLASVSQIWLGSSLLLLGNSDSSNNVLVRPGTQTGTVDVVANGMTSTYANPAQVLFTNGTTSDTFANRTTITTSVALGSGNNTVNVAAPNSSFLITGSGNNIIQDTAGGSRFRDFGSGNNNLYGGPNDNIQVGSGANIVYDILPGNTTVTVAPHTTVDHLFIGPQTTIFGNAPQDHVAQFFVAGRTIGSGTLMQQGATLYFTADDAGDLFEVLPQGTGVLVVYRLADGVYRQQAFAGINQIAAFGGAGNDQFLNLTSNDDVQYGAGGVNFLYGGTGQLDLEKAGGAASSGSVAIGNSPVLNDLNGSAGTNTSMTLIAGPGRTIFRSNSITDVFGQRKRGDTIVTLFPEGVS